MYYIDTDGVLTTICDMGANMAKKTDKQKSAKRVSSKISKLMHEGKEQKQAIAIALEMERERKKKKKSK